MATTFLFLHQQLGNDHQVVGQHGSAHQQLESLAPLRQAAFHATTPEQNRDAPFDASPETLALLEDGTVLESLPLRSLLTTALGNTDDLYSRTPAQLNILFAEETTVQAAQFGTTPECLLVPIQRGFDLVLVGRISLQDSVLGDQTASTFSQKDFVPKFNVLENLPPLDQIRVRFENREDLLRIGDGLSFQHAAARLLDHPVGQAHVMLDLSAQRLDRSPCKRVDSPHLLGLLEQCTGLGNDLLGDANQLTIFLYLAAGPAPWRSSVGSAACGAAPSGCGW